MSTKRKINVNLHLPLLTEQALDRLCDISESHEDPDVRVIAEAMRAIGQSMATLTEEFLPAAFPLAAHDDGGAAAGDS